MRATRAFVAGAAAAYLLDPRHGRRRRSVLRDRALATTRRAERLGARKARLAEGRMRGVAARVRRIGSEPDVATDDQTVLQRIRSDALRDAGVSTRDVEVRVDDGLATIKGSLPSDALADDLVAKVAKVPGVEDVAAILRVSTDAERDV